MMSLAMVSKEVLIGYHDELSNAHRFNSKQNCNYYTLGGFFFYYFKASEFTTLCIYLIFILNRDWSYP